jgi:hypothetical protein
MSVDVTVLATLGLTIMIVAFNLNTESVIMRNAGKDLRRVGTRAKQIAIILGILGVVLFAFGSWMSFNPNVITCLSPSVVLSLSVMLVTPAPMLAIKALRLIETRPEYLEKHGIILRRWVRGLIAVATLILIVALAFSFKNVVISK